MKTGHPHLVAVCTGRVKPLDTRRGGQTSAIGKTSVSTLDDPRPVAVHRLGLEGDEQADLRVHGGPNRAVYAYPLSHYAFWNTVRAQARNGGSLSGDPYAAQATPEGPAPLPFGALGENLVVAGLEESQLWIGDVLQVGPEVRLVVTAPRTPCWKLGVALGFDWAPKMMQQSGFSGWYLSVVHPGNLSAGDEIVVRPGERVISLRERFAMTRSGPQASLFQDD